MKKLISILLVAVLILGMFPATALTALAAEETTVTLSIFANKGTLNGTSISWTQNGVTFTNNKGSSSTAIRTSDSDHYRIYQNSNVVITAPGNITKIVITATSSSYATAMKNSAGNEATASGSTVTIVPTASADTYTITKMTAQSRIKQVAVTYAASEPDEPTCEHTNKVAIGEAKDATCTEDGITAGVKCADCGEIITKQEEIPAKGHNYVDGVCDVCGAEQPNEVEATISFANTTQRTSYSTSAQVWQSADKVVTFTNNKDGSTSNVGDYSNPARIYKSSQVVVSCDPAYLITSITFVAGGSDQYKTPWEATLQGAGVTPVIDGDNYTVNFAAGVESFTCTATAQIRIASLKVTCAAVGAESECTHENKVSNGDAQAPTCVNPGQTDSYTCPDCGETIDAEPIPATGEHNYVDGACTVCGAAKPERYYIATYRDSEDQYYYLTSNLEDNKRYQAVAAEILPSSIDPDEADSKYVFLLTDNGDGTYYLQAEGVTGDNYLTHTGTSNTGTYTSAENAPKLILSESAEEAGTYNIHFTSDEERYLSLNEVKDNNFFAWYKGTQKQDLVLIPIEEAEDLTATLYGDVDGLTVTGDLTLDLNGHKANNVSADMIYAYDSTATKTTEGTGSLTTTATVVTDNTVDGKRYIALKGEDGAYTFHVLELKLTAISLRTSAAGIYYKGALNCDKTLKDATLSHGMVVSVVNMPGKDFATEEDINVWTAIDGAPEDGNMTSCSVFGIFKDGADNATRGAQKIYASAYLKLTNGEIVMAENGTSRSLQDVMEALDSRITESNKAAIVGFYQAWADAMSGWAISNIIAAAQ